MCHWIFFYFQFRGKKYTTCRLIVSQISFFFFLSITRALSLHKSKTEFLMLGDLRFIFRFSPKKRMLCSTLKVGTSLWCYKPMYGSITDHSISPLQLLLNKKISMIQSKHSTRNPNSVKSQRVNVILEYMKQRITRSSRELLSPLCTALYKSLQKNNVRFWHLQNKKYGKIPQTDLGKKRTKPTTNIFKNPPYRFKLHLFHFWKRRFLIRGKFIQKKIKIQRLEVKAKGI